MVDTFWFCTVCIRGPAIRATHTVHISLLALNAPFRQRSWAGGGRQTGARWEGGGTQADRCVGVDGHTKTNVGAHVSDHVSRPITGGRFGGGFYGGSYATIKNLLLVTPHSQYLSRCHASRKGGGGYIQPTCSEHLHGTCIVCIVYIDGP